MDRSTRRLLLSVLIFIIITADFSALCRHRSFSQAAGAFTYNQAPSAKTAVSYAALNTDGPGTAAAAITWEQLADVSYISKYNKQFRTAILYPVFGANVKKRAGQEWVLSGYMIPLDIKKGFYALSRNPYAACFFCGAAGVESVISLKFKKKPRRYKTDEYCFIKGTLELNDSNVNDFIYIFRNTEEVKDSPQP